MTQETTQQFSLSKGRLNRGHTVCSLAALVGIDRRTLLRLERGEAVHPAKAKKVADYFGVQVTDLLPAEQSETSRAVV
jgi:transcriptional regulator with XRE-family HTH domain